MLVENAIGTRRLWPAAVAIVVATFAATVAPQGLIALAPLLVGARAVARIIARRRADDGVLAPIAALLASLGLIFVVVFRDQTLATVAESARIKYVVGPTIAWYQDFLRYYFLTVEDSVDSSLTRRFAVLVLLLCLFGMIAVLLRRGGLPGVANGPGVAADRHHRRRAAAADVHADEVGRAVRRVRRAGRRAGRGHRVRVRPRRAAHPTQPRAVRHRAAVRAGVGDVGHQRLVLRRQLRRAVVRQAAGDRRPPGHLHLPGRWPSPTGLLAGWLHFRMDYAGHTEVANTRRNRVLASTPLLVVAVIMVVLEVGSMAKGAAQRYPVYTTAKANVDALASGLSTTSCAMADDVLVEPDTNAGLLQPVSGQKVGKYGPLGGENPVGFTPNGVSDKLEPVEPVTANPGTVNSDGSPNKPNVGIGYAAGTDGGYGPVGVNGSRAFLPFGLDPARTPVMGSYNENTVAAKANSAWYQLPPRTPDRPLVVVAAAGAIWSYDEDGAFNYGQSLRLQWGVQRPDGSFQPLSIVQPIDVMSGETAPQKAWRNLRFPLAWAPPEANVARIVADDPNLSSDQWFAFTPPRVPILETAQQLLGSQTPVLMDIATAANFPCQRPFSEHLGVAELPEYRILPNLKQMVVSSSKWQSAEDGGPFLFIQALLRTSTIPSYLRDDWYRDWGWIERYERLVPADQAPERGHRAGQHDGARVDARRTDQGAAMTAVFANVDREPARADEIRRDVTVARWVATIAGLIGFVLSIATPLLPVVQTTATLNWPQNGVLANVTSPLISQAPGLDVGHRAVQRDSRSAAAGRPRAGHRAEKRQAGRARRAVRHRQHQPRRHHRPQCRGGERATRPSGFACLSTHRAHVDGGRHVRDVRRADRSRRASRCAAGSTTRTCGRRSSAYSPT